MYFTNIMTSPSRIRPKPWTCMIPAVAGTKPFSHGMPCLLLHTVHLLFIKFSEYNYGRRLSPATAHQAYKLMNETSTTASKTRTVVRI
uniref:Uncharacterized protein MANES_05G169200 n=1 Tax=Rhizophora mucronata TaxID=61149 RepID=A0A2P2JB95_RHIMU